MPRTFKIVINPNKWDAISMRGDSLSISKVTYTFGVDIEIGKTALETLWNAAMVIPKSKVLDDGKTLEIDCDDCDGNFTAVENGDAKQSCA